MRETTWPIHRIRVAGRFRRDMGDIGQLASSIADVGLLHPIVVSTGGRLLAGGRRLEACRALGWTKVPVRVLDVDNPLVAERDENVCRQDFTPTEAVAIGRAIEEIERRKAKERQREGGRRGGRASGKLPGASGDSRDRVAAAVGMSGRTFEKARAVVEAAERDPKRFRPIVETMDRTRNVDAAFRQLRVAEISARAETEASLVPGVLRALQDGAGRYRCIYLDPPWSYRDSGCRGASGAHYPTMDLAALQVIDVPSLLHAGGGHVWMWTTAPMVRERAPHDLLDSWGLEWVGEIYWCKPRLGIGRWLRGQVEILILGVPREGPRIPLLRSDLGSYFEAPRGAHSEKPPEVRRLIESASPGPRLEMFARAAARGWDRWGLEAPSRADRRRSGRS